MKSLESQVYVDPPLEEYPDIVFRKAEKESDGTILKDHPKPKEKNQAEDFFAFDNFAVPVASDQIASANNDDAANANSDLFAFAVDNSARGPVGLDVSQPMQPKENENNLWEESDGDDNNDDQA